MTPEWIIVQLAVFFGTAIAAAYAYLTSRKTKESLKPIEQRSEEHSQKMQVLKADTDAVDGRVAELEHENELLQESREARGQEIAELKQELGETKQHVKRLEDDVKLLTDEKASVIAERDSLRTALTNAESKINDLELKVVKLEAEQNATERLMRPILDMLRDALAKNAAHPSQAATPPAEPPSAEAAA